MYIVVHYSTPCNEMEFILQHRFFRRECLMYSWRFHKACLYNRHWILRDLAHEEHITDYKTDEMYELLLHACKSNYVNVVKFMIKHNVKVYTYHDEDPIYDDCFGSSSMTIYPKEDTSVFTQCAETGNLDIMRLFESMDVTKNISGSYGDKRIIFYDAIKVACCRRNIEILQYLIEQYGIVLDTSKQIYWEFIVESVWSEWDEIHKFRKLPSNVFDYLVRNHTTENGVLRYACNIVDTERKYMMTPEQVIAIDKILSN